MSDTTDRITREEICAAADSLVRLCQRHKLAVAGFVWGITPPLILNFGNTKEQHDIPAMAKMFLGLCDMVEDKVMNGVVEIRHVEEIN
ncbi:MAG: hypothetical protein ACREQ5_40205 [Candidatus Dormibacteria bacterium]